MKNAIAAYPSICHSTLGVFARTVQKTLAVLLASLINHLRRDDHVARSLTDHEMGVV